MLELIKTQFESKFILNKQHFYLRNRPGSSSHMVSNMYPTMNEYYHELNPGFIHHFLYHEYFEFVDIMTVRDGSAILGSFLLNNYQSFKKIKTHFIIHPEQAKLVPPNLKQQFSCWSIQQHKKIAISDAKRVFIAGIVSEQTFPSLERLLPQIQMLKEIPNDCQVDIFLPIRSNPLNNGWKEFYDFYQLVDAIKSLIPDKKLNFMTSKEVMARPSWRDVYFIDLMIDQLVIADNFLCHYIANRGGTVSSFSAHAHMDSVFEIDLSFNHKIQFFPLIKTDSLFADMMLYKKEAGARDYAGDPLFHHLLRKR